MQFCCNQLLEIMLLSHHERNNQVISKTQGCAPFLSSSKLSEQIGVSTRKLHLYFWQTYKFLRKTLIITFLGRNNEPHLLKLTVSHFKFQIFDANLDQQRDWKDFNTKLSTKNNGNEYLCLFSGEFDEVIVKTLILLFSLLWRKLLQILFLSYKCWKNLEILMD